MEFRQHRDAGTKPTRYYSNKQESKVAKAIGGKKVANSGATPYNKGDVVEDNFLYECKTVTKDQESFSIKRKWIEKNREESIFMKKDYTAIVFSFGPSSPNYYVLDEATFMEMKEALNECKHRQ